jgi:hypothetical protein
MQQVTAPPRSARQAAPLIAAAGPAPFAADAVSFAAAAALIRRVPAAPRERK